MKDLVNDIKNFDAVENYNALKDISKTFLESYKATNPWKIRLIDMYILYNFVMLIIQLMYCFVIGKDPMESLISGWVCNIGSITLAGNIYCVIKIV